MKTAWTCFALAWAMASSLTAADPDADARGILDTSGVRGGLIVHLGCGDGRLTAAVRAGDSYLVHGLDADPQHVTAARKHIQSLGQYVYGLAIADNKLFLSTLDGKVICIVAR
jgi:2-polyprenyl-3-methyl-5-hydroxy-6-metoxy-1,4-benzoquinol methylase